MDSFVDLCRYLSYGVIALGAFLVVFGILTFEHKAIRQVIKVHRQPHGTAAITLGLAFAAAGYKMMRIIDNEFPVES